MTDSFDLRVFAHRHAQESLDAEEQDQHGGDERQDRPPDEELGEIHDAPSPPSCAIFAGSMSLLIVTGALLESLFWPDVTTVWPASSALGDLDRGCPCRRPVSTNTCLRDELFACRRGWRRVAPAPLPYPSPVRPAASPGHPARSPPCLPPAASGAAPHRPPRAPILPGRGSRSGRRDDVDVVAVEARDDGRLRQRDDILDGRQLDADAGELAGTEVAVGVLDLGPDGNEARLRVDLRIDADDLALVGEARPPSARTSPAAPSSLSPSSCSGTVKSTRIVSSCCSVAMTVPGCTYCSDIDARNADRAGERRLDRLLVEHRLDLCQRRLGGSERARRVLQRCGGIDAGLAQRLRRAPSRPCRARARPAPTSGRRARPHHRSARAAAPRRRGRWP